MENDWELLNNELLSTPKVIVIGQKPEKKLVGLIGALKQGTEHKIQQIKVRLSLIKNLTMGE